VEVKGREFNRRKRGSKSNLLKRDSRNESRGEGTSKVGYEEYKRTGAGVEGLATQRDWEIASTRNGRKEGRHLKRTRDECRSLGRKKKEAITEKGNSDPSAIKEKPDPQNTHHKWRKKENK